MTNYFSYQNPSNNSCKNKQKYDLTIQNLALLQPISQPMLYYICINIEYNKILIYHSLVDYDVKKNLSPSSLQW